MVAASSDCVGMTTTGRGRRKIELEVRRLPRDGLPSVHTVHVRATSKSDPVRTLHASWTFIVVDKPLIVTLRCVVPPSTYGRRK